MTASIRQTAANRENSKRSTGPKTPEGKAQSRRNALKHGLAGHGIVLPDEEQDQVEAKIDVWSQGFNGWDDRDKAMIEQAAVEHVRVVRSQRIERELLIKQCQRAETHWDIDRCDEAKNLLKKLHRNPLIHASRLESTRQGCDLLIERWVGLLSALENGQPWGEIHRNQALDALGVARDFRDVRTKIDAHPGEAIFDVQKKVAESELKRLRTLKEDLLIDDDDDDRDRAMIGLGITDHPTILIRRYEAVCQKRFQAALKWLEKSRKHNSKPSRRIEQSAIDRLAVESDVRVWTMFKGEMDRQCAKRIDDSEYLDGMKGINQGMAGLGYPLIQIPSPNSPLTKSELPPMPVKVPMAVAVPNSPTLPPTKKKGRRDVRNKRGR